MSEAEQNAAAEQEAKGPEGLELDCIFGVKRGMTRVFEENGDSIPVTVVDLSEKTVVSQVKTQAKEGYSAVQLGFRKKKQQRAKKPEIGHFKKSEAPAFYNVEEFKLSKDVEAGAGTEVAPVFLEAGKFVDVRSRTKGKGMQGVMKRWNFSGGKDSHGHSLSHRMPGSIGQCTSPARVMPGKKMAGHMGDVMQTTQNLKVVAYDLEKKVLLIRGAVPGGRNAVVRITKAKKKG